MRNSIMMALFAFTVAGLVMFASPSMAVHKGVGDLTCGTCHTMHSSQGGQTETAMGGTDGSYILLRASITDRSELHLFCLSCHAQTGAQGGDTHMPLVITAPKVLTSFGYSSATDDFTDIGAGGDFGGDVAGTGTQGMGATYTNLGVYTGGPLDPDDGTLIALGKGHSLGSPSTVKPPGNVAGSDIGAAGVNVQTLDVGLSCTTCHDPHGTDTSTDTINRFRNLKVGNSNTGQNPWSNAGFGGGYGSDIAETYAGGATDCKALGTCVATASSMGTSTLANTNVWPVFCDAGNCAGNENSYTMSGAGFNPTGQGGSGTAAGVYVGMSLFCAQCHGAWHEEIAANEAAATPFGQDWRRHPVNNVLADAGSDADSGSGVQIFDGVSFDGIADGSRLPVSDAAGSGYSPTGANGTSRVFCLSCHFVHGSPNRDILRWDYTNAVSIGSQSGNGVPTGTGCQQCHNR